jgi:hypothetical protein
MDASSWKMEVKILNPLFLIFLTNLTPS